MRPETQVARRHQDVLIIDTNALMNLDAVTQAIALHLASTSIGCAHMAMTTGEEDGIPHQHPEQAQSFMPRSCRESPVTLEPLHSQRATGGPGYIAGRGGTSRLNTRP